MRIHLLVIAAVLAAVPAAAQIFDPARAAPEADLAHSAGKADLNQVSLANQENQVAGNSVNGNSVTGAVGISGNAFQNLSGLAVINANSGNNVAINAALNVNVAILPK